MITASKPAVCILMATYNGEPYIVEQIESIQAQTFKEWQLIVSDDGSTDGTVAVLKHAAEEDSRIVVLEGLAPMGSARENFTRLVSYSNAPYVMFCDQDDVWSQDKIEVTLGAMQAEEDLRGSDTPLLIFTDMEVVDQNLKTIAPSFIQRSHINPKRTKFMQVVAQALGAGCTMMANQSLINLFKMSSYDPRIIMHDWWISLIAAAFGTITYLDKPTSKYRQHGSNSVGSNSFSPLKSARNADAMRDRVLATTEQAACFYDSFSGLLADEDRRSLEAYISIPKISGFFNRLGRLVESRAWKGGLRKVGQIMVIAELDN